MQSMPGRRGRVFLFLRFAVITITAIILMMPFMYMLGTSFKKNAYFFETPPRIIPRDPTLDNYTEVWRGIDFARYFLNSTFVATSTTLIVLVLASMMAFAFARFEFPGKRIAFLALLTALMIPGVVMIVPQFILAKNLNLLNTLLALVIFYSGGQLAFTTFLLRGFFEGVPKELDEAMAIDGNSIFRRFRDLYLPLATPALATAAIFVFLGSWDEFIWALTVIDDPNLRTLPMAIAALQGQRATEWGLVFAASCIAVLPVITVYVAAQRQFLAGITAGAVRN
jgi:multiple sugar transport system permease protein